MNWEEMWPYKQIGLQDKEQETLKENMRECCIAFIDILGFKEMVEKDMDKVILALRYIKMFRDSFFRMPAHLGIPEEIDILGEPYEELMDRIDLPKATMFSDSIVISKEIDEYFSFSDFVYFIAHIQYELLREGILIRGGIDIGQVYHDESFLFGPGMLSAYLLESTVSKYPRITIHENALAKVREWDYKRFEKEYSVPIRYNGKKEYLYPMDIESEMHMDEFEYIKATNTNQAYIDYLYFGCDVLELPPGISVNQAMAVFTDLQDDTLWRIRNVICDGLEYEDERVKEKYLWMKTYFNRTLERIFKTYKNKFASQQEEDDFFKRTYFKLLI